ncbi:MAG TPA: alpha/beta hydrolase, partial [Solirubrobacterales bacterium]|nr:alpha/beta hydrolase [Solirubrobacterales bacterium]
EKPVLFAWGESDRFFKPELAERLAAMIPNSRIEKVEGGRTFVALDDPEKVSNLIVEFMNGAVTPAGRTDAQRSTLAGADGR